LISDIDLSKSDWVPLPGTFWGYPAFHFWNPPAPTTTQPPGGGIFGTGWEATPLNWLLFFFGFGFIWMWFI